MRPYIAIHTQWDIGINTTYSPIGARGPFFWFAPTKWKSVFTNCTIFKRKRIFSVFGSKFFLTPNKHAYERRHRNRQLKIRSDTAPGCKFIRYNVEQPLYVSVIFVTSATVLCIFVWPKCCQMPHFPSNKWLSHVLLLVWLFGGGRYPIGYPDSGADERHITEKQPHK